MEQSPLGPVFAKRGPQEQPVNFRITGIGVEVDFPGTEDYAAWSKSFDWGWVQVVTVEGAPNGSSLLIDDYRFRFPEMIIAQLRKVIEPHLPEVGTSINPKDPPPPPLKADLTFEPKRTGCDIFHSDWIATDHEDLIDASAAWLRQQTGIERVVHDDIQILMVKGAIDEELRSALRTWWAWNLDGFDSQ